MKQYLCVVLLVLLSYTSKGTAQLPDFIVYNGDTLSLHSNPLALYPKENWITPKNLFNSDGCFFTACWRGYVATWGVEKNKLYLKSVRNPCYPTQLAGVQVSYKNTDSEKIGSEYADLKQLFPKQLKNGKVFADWVNDEMYVPFGSMLDYVHMGYESIYEFEYKFTIKNGKVEQVEKLDNRKSKFVKGNINVDSLIDWSNLPKLPKDSIVKVLLSFSANKDGVIDSVTVLRGFEEDNPFTREAVRVIKNIPWSAPYRHGKHVRSGGLYPFKFVQPIDSAELRELKRRDARIKRYTERQVEQIIKQRENISDSIKILSYNEQRDTNSRFYRFSYMFTDYAAKNKYINEIRTKVELQNPNNDMIKYAIDSGLMRHHDDIPNAILTYWRPIQYPSSPEVVK